MTRARDIANLVDANGDIVAGALDNAQLVNDTTPQLGGALDAQSNTINNVNALGIGTSSPQREVQIYDASATNAFLAINHIGVGSGATDGMLLGVDGNNDAIIHNYENSNMIFRTNDIERLRIDSAGRVTMPYQPAFSAHCSVHAVNNTIVFDQVATNRGNHYNSTTGFFTAPVAGAYYFSFFAMNGSSNANLRVRFHINNAAHPSGEHYGGVGYTGALNYNQLSVMSVLILNANDTVSVFWDPTYNNLHSYHNKFNGYLIG